MFPDERGESPSGLTDDEDDIKRLRVAQPDLNPAERIDEDVAMPSDADQEVIVTRHTVVVPAKRFDLNAKLLTSIVADGHCGFRAVAHQQLGNQERWKEVRLALWIHSPASRRVISGTCHIGQLETSPYQRFGSLC